MQGVTNQANSSLKSILEQHGISGTPTLLQQLVRGFCFSAEWIQLCFTNPLAFLLSLL